MELLEHLSLGFSVALTLNNLLYCLIGCLLGTLIGVLPGIGPVATIAMIILGLLLGLVGTDVNSGMARFSTLPFFSISFPGGWTNFSPVIDWGIRSVPELSDGIGFVAVAMGVFGLAEIMKNLEQGEEAREVFLHKVTNLWL